MLNKSEPMQHWNMLKNWEPRRFWSWMYITELVILIQMNEIGVRKVKCFLFSKKHPTTYFRLKRFFVFNLFWKITEKIILAAKVLECLLDDRQIWIDHIWKYNLDNQIFKRFHLLMKLYNLLPGSLTNSLQTSLIFCLLAICS